MQCLKKLFELPGLICICITNIFQLLSKKNIKIFERMFCFKVSSNKNEIRKKNLTVLFYLDILGIISNYFVPFEKFTLNFISLNIVILLSFLSIEKYIESMAYIKTKLPREIFAQTFETNFVMPIFSLFTLIISIIIGVSYTLSIYFLKLIPLNITTTFGYILMFIAVILAFIGYFCYLYLMYLMWYIRKESFKFSKNKYSINLNQTLDALKEISDCFKFLNNKFLMIGGILSIQYILLSKNYIDINNFWFVYSYSLIIIFVIVAFLLFNVVAAKMYTDMYDAIKNVFLNKYYDSYISENDTFKKNERFKLYNFLYNINPKNEISLLYRLSSGAVSLLTLLINLNAVIEINFTII